MKKLVNGKVIDITNIELFKLAAEGMALQKTATSSTSDGIACEINSVLVRKYLKQYDLFFKYMPYPLYAIESDIKYATLGNFIKGLAKEKIHIWVKNGLHIRLDNETGMTLRFINNTWSIIYDKSTHEDNTSMELFKDCIGYKEYNWVLKKVINKESTSEFYREFMPKFMEACNYQPMVLKWELENILTFSSIPNRIEFKQNRIININSSEEYQIDIYCSGVAETDEVINTWSLDPNNLGSSTRKKSMKLYDFDTYIKNIEDTKTKGKISKTDMIGLQTMFIELCNVKNGMELKEFPDFTGAIMDTSLVFVINKRLYIAKSNRLVEANDIAHGVELYTLEKGKVYFTKSKRINEKVSEDALYCYSIKDNNVRLCKIMYTY